MSANSYRFLVHTQSIQQEKNAMEKKVVVRDQISRRSFLKMIGAAAGSAGVTLFLNSCATPTAAPTQSAGGEVGLGMVDTSAYKKDPPWVIARSGMGEVNSWQAMATLHFDYYVREKYKDLFSEVHTAAATFDPAKQVSDMEDLLTRNPDIMIVQPVTGGNIVAQIEQAMGQGIPVILVGARAYTDNYVSYHDRDNAGVGRTYADYIAKQLGGKGNVAVMMGLAGNTYAEDVLRGVNETLATYPDIKILGPVYGAWSPVEGKEAMQGLLASEEQIDGIINDGGNMGIGIVDAYLDAGLTVPPMCGDDGNGWLRKAKENNIKFLSVQGGAEQYADGVEFAVKTMRGEPVSKIVLPDVITFDETQLDEYYRDDYNDQYWAINKLPVEVLDQNFKN
jgi:ribose transport system substrate-binding protein